jgi:hypothetical protein
VWQLEFTLLTLSFNTAIKLLSMSTSFGVPPNWVSHLNLHGGVDSGDLTLADPVRDESTTPCLRISCRVVSWGFVAADPLSRLSQRRRLLL